MAPAKTFDLDIPTTMAKWLIISGIILIAVGLAWPWLPRLGLGHLPGDIHVKRDGVDFYFPVTTSIIISLILSVIFWLLKK